MSNNLLKIKNDLIQVVDLINSFQSENIQIKLFDTLMHEILLNFNSDIYKSVVEKKHKEDNIKTIIKKKVSKQEMLNKLVDSDYFDTDRSLQDIIVAIKNNFECDIKSTQLSGMLLRLTKLNRLSRVKKGKFFSYTNVNNKLDS